MPHAYTEDQLVEQPAIGLFVKLGWTAVSAPHQLGQAAKTRRGVNRSRLRHLPAISPQCLFQGACGLARGREQSLNESPGLAGIKPDMIALIDDSAGDLADVRNDKGSHRASLNCGRLLEELFICRREARDQARAFLLFSCRLHAPNVCRCGTHRED